MKEKSISQNDNFEPRNELFNQNDNNENNIISQEYDNDSVTDFNFLHYIICFISNLILIIITITEFIKRIKNKYLITIFDYLVDFFIFFSFFFILAYFYRKKKNFLKGLIYYPFCSAFWGSADVLSIYYIKNNNEKITNEYNDCNALKIYKFILILLSIIVNVIYYKLYKN